MSAMTPPLCPTCGRRASQRANYFPSMGRGGFIECPSPFHDAGDWGPALLEALALVLPLAKGYAAAHQVGSNQRYIEIADETLAAAEGRKEEVHDG